MPGQPHRLVKAPIDPHLYNKSPQMQPDYRAYQPNMSHHPYEYDQHPPQNTHAIPDRYYDYPPPQQPMNKVPVPMSTIPRPPPPYGYNGSSTNYY